MSKAEGEIQLGGCEGPGLQIGGGEFALRLSGLVRDVVFQKRTPVFHKYTYMYMDTVPNDSRVPD